MGPRSRVARIALELRVVCRILAVARIRNCRSNSGIRLKDQVSSLIIDNTVSKDQPEARVGKTNSIRLLHATIHHYGLDQQFQLF